MINGFKHQNDRHGASASAAATSLGSTADNASINSIEPDFEDDEPLVKQPLKTGRTCTFRCSMISLLVVIFLGIGVSVVFYTVLDLAQEEGPCDHSCRMILVESVAEGLPSEPPHLMSTYEGWMMLLNLSQSSIDIASFYWTLTNTDKVHDPSDAQGHKIYNKLKSLGKSPVNIRVVENEPNEKFHDKDSHDLDEDGAADVLSIDFKKMTKNGGGVLHTKFWIIDNKHFYIGSANMDWRSLTQINELGVIALNCSCLTRELSKVFSIYWEVAQDHSKLPQKWPDRVTTKINVKNLLRLMINGTPASTTFGISPPVFQAKNWSSDLELIWNAIKLARKRISIAVMDYSPTTLYNGDHNRYWADIDNSLRHAVFDRGIEVRLMIGWWNHSLPEMKKFLHSLAAINGTGNRDRLGSVEVRLYIVPSNSRQRSIPFARVNHKKYMVTDNAAFIGTSNWSGDYFTNTAGVGLLVNQTGNDSSHYDPDIVQSQLQAVFDRDWNSPFAHPLDT
ncbi:5'-3' exonuclease PLD3-like isoform X2 [Corticium candelabrum]|uniref:5'-3' exonuclease PLD3-like isoform X2 n=1 Tax=Corticium candelabrum TaxID=121492 RepID=UPI002E272F7B|nr:5'-3' exonuclease PLD3-like isoform X2 [Corticium candelabrum]